MKFALIALGLASYAFGGIITSESSNSNVKTLSVAQGTKQGAQSGSAPTQQGPLVRPAFNQNGTSIYGNIKRDQNGQEGQPKGERKQLTEAEKAEFEAKRAEFEAKRGENGFGQRGERKQLTEAEKAEFEAKRAEFEAKRAQSGQNGGNGGNGFGFRGERKELTEEEKADLEAKRAAWSKTEEGQAFEKKFEEWRNNQGQNGGNFTHRSQLLIKPAQSTNSTKI